MEKGEVAGKSPKLIELEEGKKYAWCTCGKSAKQPFCDASHKGSDFKPMMFAAEGAKKSALCMCKQTNNPPYCDGSHSKL